MENSIVVGSRVRVARGRKVPIGTLGVVFWIGPGKYGQRAGIVLSSGGKVFTSLANLEHAPATLSAPTRTQPAPVVSAAPKAPDARDAFLASLRARYGDDVVRVALEAGR